MIDAVREGGLLPAGTPLVAMLSGGRDSVCLLDLAVRLLGADVVTALHVNYGLRDDSDADEFHCAALCERLGVSLEVERPRRPEGPGNLQAWARDTRYAAAAQLAESDASLIATGHTADDQVETILYRLASSPSRRALLGMRPRDGKLVRPLLPFTRERTTAYCEERGLEWRDDPSNAEHSYARNRVRHGLAAALAEVHPAAAQNVLRTAALLRDEAEILDALVAAELDGFQRGAAGKDRARPPRRAAAGAAPPRRPAARRPRRRSPRRRRRQPRRGGRGAAAHRHRDARPRRRSPRDRRARRAARRAGID